jgi:hypothetical protein
MPARLPASRGMSRTVGCRRMLRLMLCGGTARRCVVRFVKGSVALGPRVHTLVFGVVLMSACGAVRVCRFVSVRRLVVSRDRGVFRVPVRRVQMRLVVSRHLSTFENRARDNLYRLAALPGRSALSAKRKRSASCKQGGAPNQALPVLFCIFNIVSVMTQREKANHQITRAGRRRAEVLLAF